MKTRTKIASVMLAGAMLFGAGAPAHAGHSGPDLTVDRWVCKWFPVFC